MRHFGMSGNAEKLSVLETAAPDTLTHGLDVRLTIEDWEETEQEAAGLDPERGWTLFITVAHRTHYAGRTESERDAVRFYWFSDPPLHAKDPARRPRQVPGRAQEFAKGAS